MVYHKNKVPFYVAISLASAATSVLNQPTDNINVNYDKLIIALIVLN